MEPNIGLKEYYADVHRRSYLIKKRNVKKNPIGMLDSSEDERYGNLLNWYS